MTDRPVWPRYPFLRQQYQARDHVSCSPQVKVGAQGGIIEAEIRQNSDRRMLAVQRYPVKDYANDLFSQQIFD